MKNYLEGTLTQALEDTIEYSSIQTRSIYTLQSARVLKESNDREDS